MTARVPKISVCVPTYNRSGMLKPFLESIFAQTFTDYEVIVSDNCSTDATPAVMSGFSDGRLRSHRNETNIGPFPNMNLLLQMARGDYVCIVHDDDLYAPTFLERLSGMLDAHPSASMVHCAAYEVDANGASQRVVRAYPDSRVIPGNQEFLRYLENHNVCCSSVMARRTAYLETGGFDTDLLCADYMMWVRLALRGDVAYVADPLVEMRVHPITVTSWLNPARWHQEFRTILDRGLALARSARPGLVDDETALKRRAARTQGRRFLVAELAAVSHGDFALANGYRDVLRQLRDIGLSPAYTALAALCTNPIGQHVLAAFARVRRARARRLSSSLQRKTVQA